MMEHLPRWYLAISISTNVYLLLAAVFFLVRRPKVLSQSLMARGMALLCVALVVQAGRSLYRLAPGGIEPTFGSDLDAFTALVPSVLMASAVTCWIVDQVHARHVRGR